MKIPELALSYLENDSFSDEFHFKIDNKDEIQDRIKLIEEIVSGQKVIHVGCLDHIPLITSRIKQNIWMHQRLTKISSECLGIDIDRNGINFVRNELGIENIIYGDLAGEDKIPEIENQYWDFAVLSDVLEHIDNPVFFIQKFMANYGHKIGTIIISVPNAFRINNIRTIFRNEECINSDHRYWFSPYTISKIVSQSGLTIEKIQMCQFVLKGSKNSWKTSLKNMLLNRYPLAADTIVVLCKPKIKN